MKELLLVRHAKSSWANIGQDDFARPLNERGHRDAPEMANRLVEKKVKIEQFISSPALRAITTATYFADAYQVKATQILQLKSLYHAPPKAYYSAIEKIDDAIYSVALFAHNPGITEFVLAMNTINIDNMPTCGVFAIKLHTNHWREIRNCKKEFWFFNYPKLAQ